MIGLQKIIIDQNYRISDLAKEIGKNPAVIYNWFRKNKISDKYLDFLADKFNVTKEYLNQKANDINTYQPKQKGFNEYKTDGDITTVFIKKRNGEIYHCIIDTEDFDKVNKYRWCIHYNKTSKEPYYVKTTIYTKDNNGKMKASVRYLHSIIMEVDKYIIVDHINNDPLDNRKENLRITSQRNNLKNRSGKNSNNKSGYRNVFYNKQFKKTPWQVQLQINGKNTRLGNFADVDEAGQFAEEMRQKYYGKYAGKS